MRIKLSKHRRILIWRTTMPESVGKPPLIQFNGWDYWFIRIPFTKIVIHYFKYPF